MREDYCDGLGDCLPACPTGAITFEEREAPEYNEEAVKKAKMHKAAAMFHGGCPGSRSRAIERKNEVPKSTNTFSESRLRQWPVQIKLVPVTAPYFENADLLISADCAAYAYGNFHADFIKNRITLIGCPKLDDTDYSEKLTEIIALNNIKSVTVVRMEVPCCGGIENAAKHFRLKSKMDKEKMSCKFLQLIFYQEFSLMYLPYLILLTTKPTPRTSRSGINSIIRANIPQTTIGTPFLLFLTLHSGFFSF